MSLARRMNSIKTDTVFLIPMGLTRDFVFIASIVGFMGRRCRETRVPSTAQQVFYANFASSFEFCIRSLFRFDVSELYILAGCHILQNTWWTGFWSISSPYGIIRRKWLAAGLQFESYNRWVRFNRFFHGLVPGASRFVAQNALLVVVRHTRYVWSMKHRYPAVGLEVERRRA